VIFHFHFDHIFQDQKRCHDILPRTILENVSHTHPPLAPPLHPAVMSKSPTKVQFTVGKLDAGMAILLTQDHHQIEFPSILLPETVTTGSIIDLSVSQNPAQEAFIHKKFLDLQSTIRSAFASKSPATPVLTLRNGTQTSAVLEWEVIDIATAELKSLTLWRDGTRLGSIPKPLTTTTTKLSGLAIDTDYTFQLVLCTTAGTYSSDPLKIRTHKLTNLSGITVCEGILPGEQHERLASIVEAIGTKPIQKRCRIDTTHFICSVPEGEEWQRAREMNVPIVVVDWIEACQREGKIVGVRGYYLDADPALRPKGSASTTMVSPTPSRVSQSIGGGQVSPKENVVGTDTAAAVDQENERVLNSARGVTSSVVTETAPAGEKENTEQKTEINSNENSSAKVEGEEKFDDVTL
jgi:chitin biosynthesis protein CHS5